ncbi:sialidase family protein [Lactobacillus sp. ESL0703]|uniref:sialidase family protein n=1 Tax=Lactobacillus sp. ESL0703 TaxID=2983218 RepID=UPI0023F6BF3C|nr:sialidase family protein [Lactobacillus sp. ESL0703]MDF7669092.1 sialidase family protein [Lactobacillus sp. ESL0703]
MNIMRMLSKKRFLLILGFASLGLTFGYTKNTAKADTNGSIVTIATKTQFPDTKSPSFLYGRGLVTTHTSTKYNGRLYATSEHYVNDTPTFLIFESLNNGKTWSKISEIKDTHNFASNGRAWGNRYQPFLYELPEQIGQMPKGTIICAGNSIPGDLSKTSIVLYYSTDHARSWKYLSTIATGGYADVNTTSNGPVWEPFVNVVDHKLVCYFSDERDKPAHSQKLSHRVSIDGINWSNEVDDVAFKSEQARPGMVTVAKMANGKYIMTYEVVNSGEWRTNYKISNDGLTWNASDEGTRLAYGGAPYVVVMHNGDVVANTDGSGDLYVNKQNGNGAWQDVKISMPLAYSRSLTVLPNDDLLIVSGGPLKSPTDPNSNSLTSMIYSFK